MLLKIFLYDDGIYTKPRFGLSVAEALRQIIDVEGINAELHIHEYNGTPAYEWFKALNISNDTTPELSAGFSSTFAWAAFFETDSGDMSRLHPGGAASSVFGMLRSVENDMDASARVHRHIIDHYTRSGVNFIDGTTAYIEMGVKIDPGACIYPNVFIEGDTSIGAGTVIYPGCRIQDSRIGENCVLEHVKANGAVIEDSVSVGPYVNLRPGTHIASECKIGDFVEVKNSNVGRGTKLPHLSYIGDADVGERVNVGCGTVFVNYDGKNKHRTVVGNDVFLGCNTNLVAPVKVADGAFTAAGSTVTEDVPEEALAIARAKQVNKTGWVSPKKR